MLMFSVISNFLFKDSLSKLITYVTLSYAAEMCYLPNSYLFLIIALSSNNTCCRKKCQYLCNFFGHGYFGRVV